MNKKIKSVVAIFAITILSMLMVSFQTLNIQTRRFPHFIRIACIGDSITEDSGYSSNLQSLLGSRYLVKNFGVSGSTVLLASWRPYMKQPEFQSAKEFQPNITIIILGTNDAHIELHQYNESFENDYEKLIVQFRQLKSKPQIWIAKPPPILSNSLELTSTYFTETIILKIEEVAKKQNLPIIDLYDTFGNNADYSKDGVHPNSQGAALIASLVCKAITEQNLLTN